MNNYSFLPQKTLTNKKDFGFALIACVVMLWGIGLFALYFCSYSYSLKFFQDGLYLVKRHLIASSIGFIGLLFFVICPMELIKKMLPAFVLVTIVLCFCTFIPGIREVRNGACRWIKLPFFTFQPSELVKFVLILFLANYFAKYQLQNEETRSVAPAVLVLIVFMSLVLLQKDFSTSIFLLLIGLVLFFVTGSKLFWILPAAVIGIPGIVLMVLLEPYRMNRIAAYLNPDEFIRTYGYQSNASRNAISTGGFWGQGIGSGLEKLNHIPEVQADYIFAGWAEAMGFVGVVFYFILLCAFIFFVIKIAMASKNRFASIGTLGCGFSIFFQSLMNCAVVCGLCPTTGIPLPFFSSGGSSILVTLWMCGFMINAAKNINNSDKDEISDLASELGVVYE